MKRGILEIDPRLGGAAERPLLSKEKLQQEMQTFNREKANAVAPQLLSCSKI